MPSCENNDLLTVAWLVNKHTLFFHIMALSPRMVKRPVWILPKGRCLENMSVLMNWAPVLVGSSAHILPVTRIVFPVF